MINNWTLSALLLFMVTAGCSDTTKIPQDGVSKKLAERRKANISDITYDISFDIPEDASEPIRGHENIHFRMTEPMKQLVLDFDVPESNLHEVKVEGKPVPYGFINEHILITGDHLQTGKNTVQITFTAGDRSLNRNPDYLYTLFVPDRASTAFPCFDQPDMKASFKLDLEIPSQWKAVTNGALKSQRDTAGRSFLQFGRTRPISTYLFAFAAGDFEKISETRDGTTINMYHRESDTARLNRNKEKAFDLQFTALQWLEDYTGIDYPFAKFDFIAIPSFQYSGMEHPGATYYRASRVFLDESATIRDELNRANLISHETAHMWFGDLVTMKWFDEVWLKEVFANFMADKITEPQYPDINHDLNFLLNHYPPAYSVDRTRGSNPVNQTLENLKDAGTLYGAIIYHKAPIVMRNLEELTDSAKLKEGLRQYLENHRYGNATWLELVRILDDQTKHNLTAWSDTWVNEPGMPHIHYDRGTSNGQTNRLTLHQNDPAGKERLWKQYLNMEIGSADNRLRENIYLDKREFRITGLNSTSGAQYILPNASGKGYGYFELDAASNKYLAGHISSFESELQRAVLWIDLWENLLHHTITPLKFHQAIVEHLPRETNAQCINLVTDYLKTNYWRFLSPRQRESHGRETEVLIWNLMRSAERKDVKAAFFKTYRSLANNKAALDKLFNIWKGDRQIENLTLSTDDRITLAYELMLKYPEKRDTLRSGQLERISNEEKKREFQFVARALAGEQDQRDAFFNDLLEEKNRQKEPWVSQALHYLHHPLRAEQSTKYIGPALEELKEVQQTGDIFFPKSWLDATLWGHSSQEAADTVRRFLEEHPDYPANLKNKILQSADMLFRTEKMHE